MSNTVLSRSKEYLNTNTVISLIFPGMYSLVWEAKFFSVVQGRLYLIFKIKGYGSTKKRLIPIVGVS